MTLTPREEIIRKLNLETGKLPWQELERFFAKGLLIHADSSFDLLDVAATMAEDKKDRIEKLLANNRLAKPGIEQVRVWHDNQQVFWTVVVAPWILIQEATDNK